MIVIKVIAYITLSLVIIGAGVYWYRTKYWLKEMYKRDVKYSLCGEAVQGGVCNYNCYQCAWYVKRGED